ncbi:MAG: acetoin utilization deacetylase AcuC-like enzyme [Cellvibrionaceae bacterium]|jgi:acetoin utilization deacetylase AcuC-like enzyme
MIPLISNPYYSYAFPTNHRFPMEKFGLLVDYCRYRGWLRDSNLFRPGKAKLELLLQGHCPDYLQRFIGNQQSQKEVRRMGLPWSDALLKRTLISPNGTFLTCQMALKYGVACHLAGGTHHAHYDFASGFCILNDLAVSAKALLAQQKVKRLVIFDCDVHQGDGTARILADEPRAFTCSVHCAKNFPARKATSDLDVEVHQDISDQAYLDTIEKALQKSMDYQKPDLLIYDAGVDIFGGDPLGLLSLSQQTIFERDRQVLQYAHRRGIAVATVIGGGYDDDRKALAQRHGLVVEAAFAVFGDRI